MHYATPLDDPTPLIVQVTGGRYDCFAKSSTPKGTYLLGFLQGMGGINESVEDGTYHFNVEEVNGMLVASLELAE